MSPQTKARFARIEKVIERVIILAALIGTLTISVSERSQVHQYKGIVKTYRSEVTMLRAALTVSCASRVTQHNASHEATAALITYYRSQLQLANDYYATSLKIIRSYPPATQHLAIVRLNANRQDLSNVLEKQEAAYVTEATFNCAH